MPATPPSAPEPTDPGGRREALVAILVIAAATVLVYSNTFDASFHFDDHTQIVQNESLRDLRSLWPPSGNRWVGYLSFALNHRLGALEVFGYHLGNLLIHVCNGLLVFWLTALTLRTPALRRAEMGPLVRKYLPLAAGLLFAVHPIATQAVTYIVQRFTSLATLFFLLSLVLYAKGRLTLDGDRPSRARAAWLYSLAIVAAAGAMRTKEISFTLPLVAAGYELLFFRPGRRLLLLAPLAATALLVPLGLASEGRSLGDVLSEASRFTAETREIPRSVYLLTQARVVVTYLRLLLLPVRQNLDYDLRLSHSLADPEVLFALAIVLVIAAAAVFLLVQARKTNRAAGALVFFGIAWFFVTSSVESSVIPIRDVIFEHRAYLPSAGAAVALGTALLWAVERLRLRIPIALQAAAALLITAAPLGVATYARNLVWKDELSLWTDVVAKSAGKARPHTSLGVAYWETGRVEDAIREYREAIRLAPGEAEAHYNLGVAHAGKGQVDEAMREYREAIRLAPGLAGAHMNLGLALGGKGQLDDAIRAYSEAIRLAPGLAEAHMNLGLAYRARGRTDDAIHEYREAIRLSPGLAGAHMNLGAAYRARERTDDAIREYREAIRLAPGSALRATISASPTTRRAGSTRRCKSTAKPSGSILGWQRPAAISARPTWRRDSSTMRCASAARRCDSLPLLRTRITASGSPTTRRGSSTTRCASTARRSVSIPERRMPMPTSASTTPPRGSSTTRYASTARRSDSIPEVRRPTTTSGPSS